MTWKIIVPYHKRMKVKMDLIAFLRKKGFAGAGNDDQNFKKEINPFWNHRGRCYGKTAIM
jgi:hypothetical protein